MDKWIEVKLSDIGKTYSGLSNKSAKDFGYGKDYIPYLNIYNNSKVNINFFEKVNIKKRENQNKVKYGDIFFTTSSETPDEVGMSSVLLDEVNEVYLNSFCFGFRLNDFNTLRPEFARYYFRGMGFRKQMNYLAQGSTRYNLSKVALLKYKAILPTIPEQSKIAEILTTIDDAIEQTEKIIAKYRRIKQGLLQDLLTKGIDENGNIRSEATHKFKDSPLGRIPVEWEIKSFFDVCSVINGRAFKPEEWSEQGLPIVRIENLNNNNAKYNYCNFRVPNKYYIDNGELLLSWSGTPGTSFGVFIWNRGKAILNQHIFIVKIKHCIRKEFFYYYYNHVVLDEMIRQSHGGVGLQHVTKEDLKRINFVVPKIEEQERVIQIAKTIDDSIETEKKYLSKLKSIKQGLMQDLLTGKVRVTHLLDKGGKSDECHP